MDDRLEKMLLLTDMLDGIIKEMEVRKLKILEDLINKNLEILECR